MKRGGAGGVNANDPAVFDDDARVEPAAHKGSFEAIIRRGESSVA